MNSSEKRRPFWIGRALFYAMMTCAWGFYWGIVPHVQNSVYAGDYILLALINIIAGMLFFKVIQKRENILIPGLIIAGLSLAILAFTMYRVIPNYASIYFDEKPTPLFGLGFHPYGIYVLLLSLLSVFILGMGQKLIALSKDPLSEPVPSLSEWGVGISLLFGLILAGLINYFSYSWGWLAVFPLIGCILGIASLLFFHITNGDEGNGWRLLTQKRFVRPPNTGFRKKIQEMVKQSFTAKFFAFNAALVLIFLCFCTMATNLPRKRDPFLQGKIFLFAALFLVVWVLLELIMSKFKGILPIYRILLVGSGYFFIWGALQWIQWWDIVRDYTIQFTLLAGLALSVAIYSFVIFSIERSRLIGGSSWWNTILWLGLPFILSLMIDLGHGNFHLAFIPLFMLILEIGLGFLCLAGIQEIYLIRRRKER